LLVHVSDGEMLQNVQADYSMESHARDLDNYVNVARNRRRRAKALLDFERHDDDELGFRKNDIITVRCCCLLFSLAFSLIAIFSLTIYFLRVNSSVFLPICCK